MDAPAIDRAEPAAARWALKGLKVGVLLGPPLLANVLHQPSY